MTDASIGPVGEHYRSCRLRLEPILSDLDDAAWDTPVPACPGWRVRDVLAHLVGIIEDAVAGKLSGPPPPELTAEEVDRHRADDPAELLRTWTAMAPFFEEAIGQGARWPAFLDVLSHEHDIRSALGLGGERDHPDVRRAAELLTAALPDGLVVDLVPREGPGALEAPEAWSTDRQTDRPTEANGAPIRLRATAFEILRLRLGRRSLAQVRALDWTGDPEPFLDRLFVFGPTPTDLRE